MRTLQCPDRLDLIHKHFRKFCATVVDFDEWGQIACVNLLTRYARTQFLDPNHGVCACLQWGLVLVVVVRLVRQRFTLEKERDYSTCFWRLWCCGHALFGRLPCRSPLFPRSFDENVRTKCSGLADYVARTTHS